MVPVHSAILDPYGGRATYVQTGHNCIQRNVYYMYNQASHKAYSLDPFSVQDLQSTCSRNKWGCAPPSLCTYMYVSIALSLKRRKSLFTNLKNLHPHPTLVRDLWIIASETLNFWIMKETPLPGRKHFSSEGEQLKMVDKEASSGIILGGWVLSQVSSEFPGSASDRDF